MHFYGSALHCCMLDYESKHFLDGLEVCFICSSRCCGSIAMMSNRFHLFIWYANASCLCSTRLASLVSAAFI